MKDKAKLKEKEKAEAKNKAKSSKAKGSKGESGDDVTEKPKGKGRGKGARKRFAAPESPVDTKDLSDPEDAVDPPEDAAGAEDQDDEGGCATPQPRRLFDSEAEDEIEEDVKPAPKRRAAKAKAKAKASPKRKAAAKKPAAAKPPSKPSAKAKSKATKSSDDAAAAKAGPKRRAKKMKLDEEADDLEDLPMQELISANFDKLSGWEFDDLKNWLQTDQKTKLSNVSVMPYWSRCAVGVKWLLLPGNSQVAYFAYKDMGKHAVHCNGTWNKRMVAAYMSANLFASSLESHIFSCSGQRSQKKLDQIFQTSYYMSPRLSGSTTCQWCLTRMRFWHLRRSLAPWFWPRLNSMQQRRWAIRWWSNYRAATGDESYIEYEQHYLLVSRSNTYQIIFSSVDPTDYLQKTLFNWYVTWLNVLLRKLSGSENQGPAKLLGILGAMSMRVSTHILMLCCQSILDSTHQRWNAGVLGGFRIHGDIPVVA